LSGRARGRALCGNYRTGIMQIHYDGVIILKTNRRDESYHELFLLDRGVDVTKILTPCGM